MRRDALLGVVCVDVEGAPMLMGERVRVAAHLGASNDRRFATREGTVIGFVYTEAAQVPADPMVMVEVPKLGNDVFYVSELERLSDELVVWVRMARPSTAPPVSTRRAKSAARVTASDS